MIRVVHVVHWPRTGITRLLETIFSDIRHDVELHLIVMNADDDQVNEFREVVESVVACGSRGNPLTKLRRLVSALRAAKPDIVHTHSFTPAILATLCLPAVRHIRTIHSVYPYFSGSSLRDRLKRFIEFRLLDRKDVALVFVADGVRKALAQRFDRALVLTIKNGVNCANINRLAQCADLSLVRCDKIAFCSVGRLEHQKGYDLLVSACELIPEGIRNQITLTIFGAGSQQDSLQRQIERAGLVGVVTLAGYRNNPYPAMAAADICIFSSRYEGFSIAAAEAMALGRPVITTRVTGIPEFLTSGIDSIVIDETSPRSLRDAMVMLVGDQPLRRQLGERGRLLAEQKFDISSTSKRYLSLYRTFLRNASGSRSVL
jgi:glycosyltransferase involved in cell wall biosynthesis